ncbi:MAG: hypothetical protein KDB27_31370 [Planctomycetales bacterium]|nr:hypothetical protein [Planctomycetales bacterium]
MSIGDSDFNENADITASDGNAGGGEFDAPPTGEESTSGGGLDFDLPPESVSGSSSGATGAADDEPDPVTQRVIQAKQELEQRLCEAASENAMSLAGARNADAGGIIGVGVSMGAIPGQSSLIVYVESESNEEEARREMVDVMRVQAASSEDLPVEVEVTGPVEAYSSNRSKFRPAPGGVSVGHFNVTAGTVGGWVRGSTGNRVRRLMMLSNNHVLANSNRARFGDSIIQPGTADGGVSPRDRIAILERFVPINFASGAINYVDCATGWCWPDLVRRDHVFHRGRPTPRFFRVGNSFVAPTRNLVVGKTGRTTDLTQGTIRATNVSINVNYRSAGIAHFRDQFSVRSTGTGTFSAGGDSGSLVWEWKTGLPQVGLLFAGGGGTTFCNPIRRVYAALQIKPFNLS